MIGSREELASLIKEYRTKRKLTQTQLAEMIGISQSYISRIEKADRKVDGDTLIAIGKALEIQLAESVISIDTKLVEDSDSYNKAKDLVCKRKETKSERAQLLLTPTTKKGLQKYAKLNMLSLNDIMENLGAAFLEASEKGSSSIEFDNAIFFLLKK